MLQQGMTETTIDGAVGVLEVRYTVPKLSDRCLSSLKLVVLSHPHPLHGGTMNNKVVTTMERTFKSLGYITVAYNFRGVAKSAGEYDHGVGEQEDLYAVVAWAKQIFGITSVTLAGFSFGSYVLLSAHPKIQKIVEVEALCTVAPPVGLYDFSQIRGGEFSWVLIQGGQDEVVSAKEILNWAVGLERGPDLYWRAKAGHFFHGELIWLKKLILLLY
ncbi:MAG: hypothetical protein L3J01_02880 [Thiomicrorhabdus sp.]|nr:hypothetical protein [Thiomicrorhabdus sp.]